MYISANSDIHINIPYNLPVIILFMSITKKILSNTFWQIAGKLVTAILGIASIKFLTGYFSADLYGQYATMFDYISFFAIAADFGLYTIGIREMAKQKQEVPFILGNILSLRLILIVITLATGGLIAQVIPTYTNTLIPSTIWLVALITSLFLIHGTLTTVLQYRLKMFAANFSLLVGKIISVGYIIFTVFYLFPKSPTVGFTHLLYGSIAGNIIMVGMTLYFVQKHTKVRLLFNRPYIKELITKSAPYGLSLVLSTIYFRIDIILIGLMRDLAEAGIYSVPLKIMEILSVIPVFFMNTLLPTLTEYIQKHKQKAARTVQNAFQFLLIIALPLLIGGSILAFPLTFAISSPQFLSGYHCANNSQIVFQNEPEATMTCANTPINQDFKLTTSKAGTTMFMYGSDLALKLILFAVFFSYLNTLFTFALIALDQQTKLLYVNFAGVAFNVITNLLIIPYYGFRGAAFTTILSEIIILFGTFYFYRKYLEFNFDWFTIIKTTFATALMGIIIYSLHEPTYALLQNWNVLLLIPIGILVYGGLLIATKTMTINKLRHLLSPE